MTPQAQRADYRSASYLVPLPTVRDSYTVADGLLHLRLAALRTEADYGDLLQSIAVDELAQYGPYASSAPRP